MVSELPGQGPDGQQASAAASHPVLRGHAHIQDSPAASVSADSSWPGARRAHSGPAASSGERVLAGDESFAIARCTDPRHLVLTGELDICSVAELTAALADAAGVAGTLHLHLTGVRYCDLAALRAIVGQTRISDHQQAPARPVVLHRPPAQMRRILQLTGWDTLPGVTVDSP